MLARIPEEMGVAGLEAFSMKFEAASPSSSQLLRRYLPAFLA
jgi:hypothetical protein